MRTVAALYIDPKGPYPSMPGVECWDEKRDARNYAGPHPVVAHPPCGRWCSMARLNESRWGAKVGDDGGCFAAALAALRQHGGVLEHPARSLAWAAHGLIKPVRGAGWIRTIDGEWVCEVWQSAWGNLSTKRTWLLLVGTPPLETDWTRRPGTHQIGGGVNTGNNQKPRLNGAATFHSPPSFAEWLVALARASRFEHHPAGLVYGTVLHPVRQ